ncbi:hypothetical protein DTO027B5_7073 [Paecilomyces variotii]|nr:hypothetical protein DTO169C6_5890 [Paecilomyces variotii]KAJ9285275.1 hypothetical protein DTO021C3_7193 [Paecilomyces variotii]KAJ9321502.1 hypothetical protein DTO027B3_7535 [Paecilomyces variotii]KAJ9331110.1 hypothetical protein DTO027B5_7073 [Paecilomyces variotii]
MANNLGRVTSGPRVISFCMTGTRQSFSIYLCSLYHPYGNGLWTTYRVPLTRYLRQLDTCYDDINENTFAGGRDVSETKGNWNSSKNYLSKANYILFSRGVYVHTPMYVYNLKRRENDEVKKKRKRKEKIQKKDQKAAQ